VKVRITSASGTATLGVESFAIIREMPMVSGGIRYTFGDGLTNGSGTVTLNTNSSIWTSKVSSQWTSLSSDLSYAAGNVGLRASTLSSESSATLGSLGANEGGQMAFAPGSSRTPWFFLDTLDDGSNSDDFRVREGTGGTSSATRAYITSGVNGWNTPSDSRLKTNIVTLDHVLSRLESMRGVRYDLIDGTPNQIGVIAQETRVAFPEAVNGDEATGLLGVSYDSLAAVAIQAAKELHQASKDQQAQIHALQTQNANLLRRLEALEFRIK
jgi:Chaperone of endosialidase